MALFIVPSEAVVDLVETGTTMRAAGVRGCR